MTIKLRKMLTPFGRRTDIQVDIPKLISELEASGAYTQDWGAASMHEDKDENLFVKSNAWSKINFDGGSDAFYTEVNLAQPTFERQELSDRDLARRDSMIYRVKRTRSDSKDYSEHADVIGPYQMDPRFNVSELQKILAQIGGKVGRVRIARLSPQSKVNPHVDYDPSYVWRYHLPLRTNQGAEVFQKRGDTLYQTHFPANGSLYWLNTGHVHWVDNKGQMPREHLLIDVHGLDEYAFTNDKMEFFEGRTSLV